MTIVFDGLTLNPDMVWEEQYSSQSVEQSVRRTLGGIPVIFSGLLSKGEPITLSSREVNGTTGPIGVLRKSVVDALLVRAGTAGSQYLLVVNGVQITVIFRHDEPPAVAMVPLIAKTIYVPTDLMRGSIKLMTV